MAALCSFDREEPPFLTLGTCLDWEPMAERQNVSIVARGEGGFLGVYKASRGQVRALGCDWRRKRHGFIGRHWVQIQDSENGRLWVQDGRYEGLPTRHALSLVMWAWHPAPRALAKAQRQWIELASSEGWL